MSQGPNDEIRLQDFTNSSYSRPHDRIVESPLGPILPINLEQGEEVEVKTVRRTSLRRKRAVFTFAVTAFTIGALMIVLCSPYSNEFLAPGPLSSPHAQLLAGHGADRCAACHGAASSSVAGWVADTVTAGHATGISQSDLCMECHKDSIREDFALHPHNLEPEELAKKSSKFKQTSFTKTVKSSLKLSPINTQNEIACSACHREHKGKQDLKALTNAQCQSCHSQNFHSFETDHPEFVSWPQKSRQRLAFDHSTHVSKHYPGKQAEFNCSQCHIDDDYQNVKSLAPFETACASCHENAIIESGLDGIAMFALPMLDMRAIEEAKLDVGTWPAAATGDFDGELSPMMRLLLMADDAAADVLKTRDASFQFSDFDPDDSQSISDAVTLVWSTKKLLRDLAENGKAEIKHRLETVLEREVSSHEAASLAAGLHKKAFAAAANRWLPNLPNEIEAKFPGSLIKIAEQANDDYLSPVGLALARISSKSRVRDELAENPLPKLMSGIGGTNSRDASIKGTGAESIAEETNIVGQPSIGSSRQTTNVPRQAPPVHTRVPTEVPIFTKSKQGNLICQTGWHRDDSALKLAYRPASHEDPFLKSWINLVAGVANADSRFETKPLFEMLTNPTGAGTCRSCHTIERNSDQTFLVHWAAKERDPSKQEFTFFSHGPHLIQPDLKDCSYCHELDTTISNASTFASFDETECLSNFKPITKASCASCHQKGLTSNDCTQCHGYHIGGHKSR